MHGVLWKWLLFLGFIFWTALCFTEYYRKHIAKHPEYDNTVVHDDIFIIKKEPPALTFWKTLSMILSVSALIYIKRSSNLIKRYSRTNLLLSCAKPEPGTRIFNTLAVYPASVNYVKDLKNDALLSDFYSTVDPKKAIASNPKDAIYTGLAGVEIIQKKLDNLEKSVASLKQRHNGSFGPGIVSGSPEFRKFLTLCQNINTSADDDSTSSLINVPGSNLISTSTSTELFTQSSHQFLKEVVETPNTTPSSTSSVKSNNIIVVNNQSEAEQSSWSTISEEVSSNFSELKCEVAEQITKKPMIEEILKVNKSFSKCSSRTSTKNPSIRNLLIEHFIEDDVSQVPGSNLMPSGASSATSTTLMSSSSNQLTSLFGDFTTSEDDDVLNTLD